MDKQNLSVLKNQFDTIVHDMDENIEFWYARELQELLGYKRWENFETAIKKAITSCETTGIAVIDHFRDITKMVKLDECLEISLKYNRLEDEFNNRLVGVWYES